jgi:hypothetical protein
MTGPRQALLQRMPLCMDRKSSFIQPEKHRPKPDRRQKHGYVQPRNVEDHWNYYKRGMYISKPGRGLPAWLLPLVAFVLIVSVIFWAAPAVINRVKLILNADGSKGTEQISLLYDDDTWTIGKPVADVFDRDDIKANRLSQGLYNEPVKILSKDCEYGFVQVRLSDGLEGFMLLEDLADSRGSIEPDLFSYRIVIASSTKRVMSHASKGTMLVEVLMGTVLYSDYRGNGISRVKLPDGSDGWISDEGVIILRPLEPVGQPADAVRYFCSTAMAFNQITVLDNGQSVRGISTVGIARQAAAVNGVTLPRTLDGIAASGEPVTLAHDADTGLIGLDQIRAGDLIIFKDGQDPEKPGDLAIYTGDSMILYARTGQSSIRLFDLTQNKDLWQQILMVRRIFTSP